MDETNYTIIEASVTPSTITNPIAGYTTIKASVPPNIISFHNIESGGEMLKITKDGFYVRGEKIPQDFDEARTVYNAFISWLQSTRYMV